MKIFITGQYITKFGELWDRGLNELLIEAMDGAITSAGLEPKDIEAIFVANKAAGNFEDQHHLNAIASQHFSHYPPAVRVEAACASGSLAVVAAEQALAAGTYKTVLVVGVEKMTDVSSEMATHILSGATDVHLEAGSTFPALYALLAQQHMAEYGTTREQLSAVAVKNHLHALENPEAQFHKKFTLDQVSQSLLVADPLRILDCSPISDGAAAVVLTSHPSSGSPQILGWGQGQDSIDLANRASLTTLQATKTAAKHAFARAKLTPTDIQVAEVHDCFTIAEIFAIEDLGFVPKGSGGAATLDNRTTTSGNVMINPSGGLKACGHPVGATGVKQVAYLAKLLKQGQYQVGLTHNVGGSGATAVVHILKG